MNNNNLNNSLENILTQYQQSFSQKIFSEEESENDDLMQVFGLTQEIKSENRQYWGRELGKCWELLVKELCKERGSIINYQLSIANFIGLVIWRFDMD